MIRKKYRRKRPLAPTFVLLGIGAALLYISQSNRFDKFMLLLNRIVSYMFHLNYAYILLLVTLLAAIYIGIAFLMRYLKKQRYLSSSLGVIDRMTGEQFEEFLNAHFEAQGYKVELTPKTADYGIDLVCRRRQGIAGKAPPDIIRSNNIVVQAKRYSGKVGISAVQEVIGGMRYYDCPVGLVVTNNYFTPNAWELAKRSDVILWDRKRLEEVFPIPPTKKSPQSEPS